MIVDRVLFRSQLHDPSKLLYGPFGVTRSSQGTPVGQDQLWKFGVEAHATLEHFPSLLGVAAKQKLTELPEGQRVIGVDFELPPEFPLCFIVLAEAREDAAQGEVDAGRIRLNSDRFLEVLERRRIISASLGVLREKKEKLIRVRGDFSQPVHTFQHE